MKLIDLSHIINDQTITYKGLPAPIICDYLSREESKKYYQEGTSFQIGKIEMVSNTGTYIDVPDENCMAIELTENALTRVSDTVEYPKAFFE